MLTEADLHAAVDRQSETLQIANRFARIPSAKLVEAIARYNRSYGLAVLSLSEETEEFVVWAYFPDTAGFVSGFPAFPSYFDNCRVEHFKWDRPMPTELFESANRGDHENLARVLASLKKHQSILARPNVTLMFPSAFRLRGGQLVEETCIVVAVTLKGVIPYGTERLPSLLLCEDAEIPVDVVDGLCASLIGGRWSGPKSESQDVLERVCAPICYGACITGTSIQLDNSAGKVTMRSSHMHLSLGGLFCSIDISNSNAPPVAFYGLTCEHGEQTDEPVFHESPLRPFGKINPRYEIGHFNGLPICKGIRAGARDPTNSFESPRDHDTNMMDARLFQYVNTTTHPIPAAGTRLAFGGLQFPAGFTLEMWEGMGYPGTIKPWVDNTAGAARLSAEDIVYKVGFSTGITKGKVIFGCLLPLSSSTESRHKPAPRDPEHPEVDDNINIFQNSLAILTACDDVPFAWPGDSGSMIFKIDENTGRAQPAALLCEGTAKDATWIGPNDRGFRHLAFATPLQLILDHFRIELYH